MLPNCSDHARKIFIEGSSIDTFFMRFNNFTESIANRSLILIVFTFVIFNSIHFFILTRRNMRNLNVLKEMITIAVCGTLMGFMALLKYSYALYVNATTCTREFTYSFQKISSYNLLLFGFANQIIVWSIVYITFQQSLIVLKLRYSLKIDNIRKSFQIFMIFGFLIYGISHSYRFSVTRIIEMKGSANCDGTFYEYYRTIDHCVYRVILSIIAIMGEVIPCILLISSSSIIIFEMNHRNTSRSRRRAAKALVLFLSFYSLAQLPLFILYSVGLYNPVDFERLDDLTFTQVDCMFFANMCVGILVYCLMSSEYRKNLTTLFGCVVMMNMGRHACSTITRRTNNCCNLC